MNTAGKMIRVVSREADGSLRVRDHDDVPSVLAVYVQAGIDDCSTDLSLRGLPVLKGLIGPFAEGRRIARYETADVFEIETREWSQTRTRRRRAAVPAVPASHITFQPAAQPAATPAIP